MRILDLPFISSVTLGMSPKLSELSFLPCKLRSGILIDLRALGGRTHICKGPVVEISCCVGGVNESLAWLECCEEGVLRGWLGTSL